MDSYEALHKEILGLVYAIIMGLFGSLAKMILGDTRKILIKDLVKEAFMAVFASVIVFFYFYETDKKGILFSVLGVTGFMSRQILETINKAGIFISSIRSDIIISIIIKNFFPNFQIPDVLPMHEDEKDEKENNNNEDNKDTEIAEKHIEAEICADVQTDDTDNKNSESKKTDDTSSFYIDEKKENAHKLFEIRNKKRYERLQYIKNRIDAKKIKTNITQEEADA